MLAEEARWDELRYIKVLRKVVWDGDE